MAKKAKKHRKQVRTRTGYSAAAAKKSGVKRTARKSAAAAKKRTAKKSSIVVKRTAKAIAVKKNGKEIGRVWLV